MSTPRQLLQTKDMTYKDLLNMSDSDDDVDNIDVDELLRNRRLMA